MKVVALSQLQVVERIQEQRQTAQKTVEIPSFVVPVTISDKFQQSKKFELKVPQIHFILRVCELRVVQPRRVPTVQTVQKTQRFHGPGAVLGVVDVPVVAQRQLPWSTSLRSWFGGGRRLKKCLAVFPPFFGLFLTELSPGFPGTSCACVASSWHAHSTIWNCGVVNIGADGCEMSSKNGKMEK